MPSVVDVDISAILKTAEIFSVHFESDNSLQIIYVLIGHESLE